MLSRLTREGVLRRLERRVGGIRAGSVSYVYMLAPAGRRLMGKALARQVREPSQTFLRHTLAIVEAHLTLREAAATGAYDLVMSEVEPVCWRRYLGPSGAHETLRPDVFVVSARGEFEYCWFLEIDLGTEYSQALVRKCRAYETYWRTGNEQQRSGTFPLVVWLAPNRKRLQEIERATRSTRNLKQELFRVVTNDDLAELFSGGAA